MKTLILCVLLGLALISFEVFVPGGVLGILGALALIFAVGIAFNEYGILGGSLTFTVVFLLLVCVIFIQLKFLPKTRIGRRLFLNKTIKGQSNRPLTDVSPGSQVIGKSAEAITPLVPSGKIKIGKQLFEATSQDGFIAKGTRLRVVGKDAFHLIVRKQQDAAPHQELE